MDKLSGINIYILSNTYIYIMETLEKTLETLQKEPNKNKNKNIF